MRRVLSPLLVLLSLLAITGLVASHPHATERDGNPNKTTKAVTATSDVLSMSLAKYCSAQFKSFESTYKSTQIATSRWTWYQGFGPTDSLGDVTGSVTSQSYFTSTYLYTQYAIRAYTPKPPCCSSCYMTAGTIDFYFWPDQATPMTPHPGQTTTSVNADGFTFTSPSVYMAFSSLVASNACGQVGDSWTNTTIAFDPTEITTARAITTLTQLQYVTVDDGTTFTLMGSAITTEPPPKSVDYNEVGQNCSTIPGYVYWPDNPVNAANALFQPDPCHPVILLPPRLLSMQRAWVDAGCGPAPGISGAYDPPRVLTPLLTATSLPTPTPGWGGRIESDGGASPASSVKGGAPSTTTKRLMTTGVSAAYDSLESSSSALSVEPSATTSAIAVTTTIVISGSHVGTVSISGSGIAGAIISGLGGSVSGAGDGTHSNAGESASKWNPTQAVGSSAVSLSGDTAVSSSQKAGHSPSKTTRSSSTTESNASVTRVSSAAATSSSGGAAAAYGKLNTRVWSFLSPILLFLI